GEIERRVLYEDRLLELLQRRTRLDTELVNERPPRSLVCVERLRLAAGPVERKHELGAQALAQRMLCDKRLKLSDELRVAAEGEIGLDSLHDCDHAALLQELSRRERERLVGEVRERRAAPERERLP